MYTVAIMDQDLKFASRLGRGLGRVCPDKKFLSASGPEEFRQLERKMGQKMSALIFSAEQFRGYHPPDLPCLCLRETPSLEEVFGTNPLADLPEENQAADPDERVNPVAGEGSKSFALKESGNQYSAGQEDAAIRSVYRFSGLKAIGQEVDRLLSEAADQEDAAALKTLLLYAPVPGKEANRVWEKILTGELNQGRRIVGIPCTPSYLLKAPSLLIAESPAGGAELGALLMRLQYDDLTPAQFMPYLVPTVQGCLAIPPVSGADDLQDTDPGLLAKLVRLARKALESSEEPTTLILLASGLALRKVRSLLPLCQEFHTVSDPEALRSSSWEQELNQLFSCFPAGRRHTEHWIEETRGE